MKRSRLKSVSDKQRKINAAEKVIVDALKELHPVCRVCQVNPSEDPHHLLAGCDRHKARGNPSWILIVCRDCHRREQHRDRKGQFELLVEVLRREFNAAIGRNVV